MAYTPLYVYTSLEYYSYYCSSTCIY